ncbi:MAG: protein translocase subunit SecF, partial [Planctomycetales bacterium]|nr:protein translocase subunit SecF [Planctomycetales bacterium]
IREELKKGATLRMAIRNGFSRATTTIVDANITTLITGVVLYAIGTDNIKGFAITLILGILISMFTAIFCSRAVFEIAERKRFIKGLRMRHLIHDTSFNFIGMRTAAATCSLILIAIGVAAIFVRGGDIFDIDFRQGTSVQILLKEPMPIANVRDRMQQGWSVAELRMEGYDAGTVYKIDTPLESEEDMHEQVRAAFSEGGKSLLETHTMQYSDLTDWTAALERSAPSVAFQFDDGLAPVAHMATLSPLPQRPQAELWAVADSDEYELAFQTENASTTDDSTAADTPESAADTPVEPAADDAAVTDDSTSSAKPSFRSKATIQLGQAVSAETVEEMVANAAASIGAPAPGVKLTHEGWDGVKPTAYNDWQISFSSSRDDTQKVLDAMQSTLNDTPAWLSSSKIGSTVASDLKSKAVRAVLVSLLGIVGYIWIRFQRIGYGLAAVLALVHDVLITLGAIALSFWLSSVLGFLLIEDFKIGLATVAALLTIIGYSLNDTIVVFDRIREVKGKSPELTGEMINTSINQTLSRTMLTSLTTLIVVAILYAFGGDGIHGFAFSLMIGVLVGTYSSIFVASPALLWMTKSA